MNQHRDSPVTASERELITTRIFDAPCDLVWQAWTDPTHIEQWWGPAIFKTRVEAMELRTGGRWRYVMVDGDGNEYPQEGIFQEIVVPERIVTSAEFGDEVQAFGDLPSGRVLTIVFEDLGRQTRMTLTILHPSAEERIKQENLGVIGGWNASFDQLVKYLATLEI